MSNTENARLRRTAACAKCVVYKCRSPSSSGGYPGFCPHEDHAEIRKRTVEEWSNPAARTVFEASDQLLREGYGKWPRVTEVVEYSKRMGYKKLGIAFCVALRREAKVLQNILEQGGFEVVSMSCMAGSPVRSDVGFDPIAGLSETLCNPLMQAEVLNENETQLNIMMGLCVGHDILFIRNSKADVTPLVVKDRVHGHNPVAALSSLETPVGERWRRWFLTYARRFVGFLRRPR